MARAPTSAFAWVAMSHLVPEMGQRISKFRASHENLRFDLPPAGCWMQMLSSIIHQHSMLLNVIYVTVLTALQPDHLEKGVLDHHSRLVVCLSQRPHGLCLLVSPTAWSQTIGAQRRGGVCRGRLGTCSGFKAGQSLHCSLQLIKSHQLIHG